MAAVYRPPVSRTDQLKAQNEGWATTIADSHPDLFHKLSQGQQPEIVWLGCSDSRVPESSLLGVLPGEVFVHRNVANVVNPDDNSLPAALLYAVEHLKVSRDGKHLFTPSHLHTYIRLAFR